MKKRLDYGVVTEFEDGTELWLEAVTDEIDGFILRDKNGKGIAMFPESEWGNGRRWSDQHTKEYDQKRN